MHGDYTRQSHPAMKPFVCALLQFPATVIFYYALRLFFCFNPEITNCNYTQGLITTSDYARQLCPAIKPHCYALQQCPATIILITPCNYNLLLCCAITTGNYAW
jgi:hypothetical protein